MAAQTINALLCMQKALKTRREQLNEVKNSSTSRTRYFDSGDVTRQDEPTYDIKAVDKKIVNINNALWKIDQKIKESNAKTTIEIDIDYDSLASEI